MTADLIVAALTVGAALVLLAVVVLAAAYQPAPADPPQCPLHEDCDRPANHTADLLARAAAAGYPDGFTTRSTR